MTETLPVPEPAAAAEVLPRPRIRTGAVIWGILLTALAGCALWIAHSATRRADALEAVLALDGFGWTVAITVMIGSIVTLIALAAVIRRLQTSVGRRGKAFVDSAR